MHRCLRTTTYEQTNEIERYSINKLIIILQLRSAIIETQRSMPYCSS